MATFSEVKLKLGLLAGALAAARGQGVIDDISVPEPSDPKDELYFRKLVSWSYVALVEAFPIAQKQVMGLLRSGDASIHTRLSETKILVTALRTVQSHNTLPPSTSNNRQRVLAETWMLTNGGTPCSWEACCVAICSQLIDMFTSLSTALAKATDDEVDRANFVTTLKAAFDTDWPAHAFDSAVGDAATEIGLKDFDVVVYRNVHLPEWKKLAVLFVDRQSAMDAVARAISTGLKGTFGGS
jgi:hypothetical protein